MPNKHSSGIVYAPSTAAAEPEFIAGNAQAPLLQGATNGTIGPQGADATYITGVNTAGTVRVNSAANLEAVISIVANAIEVLGVLFGAYYLLAGFFIKDSREQVTNKLIIGSTALMVGLMTPGLINWVVGAVRDMNLFT